MQLELTEIPDVRRLDPETLQTLTELIFAHYTSLNPATEAALENFFPAKKFISDLKRINLTFFIFVYT